MPRIPFGRHQGRSQQAQHLKECRFRASINEHHLKKFTFGVVALSPVISGPRLAKDKIVRSEDLSIGTISNTIHSARLKVDENGPGDVLATSCFIEVDIDALQLQVRVSLVGAGGVDAMFIRDDLPELGPNLVAALAGLEVDNFPHFVSWFF